MNSSELDGRVVSGIVFPNGEERFGPGMVYHYEYHGEYDDAWVIVTEGGVEAYRHNVKYLSSIVWAKEKP
jgi:hypothetical protein